MSVQEKYTKRKLKSTYVSTIVSISLVLFMLGLVGMLVLHSKKLSDYAKENLGFNIFLKDDTDKNEIQKFQKLELDASKFVKSVAYVSKEQAAIEFEKELGEDFLSFLGTNPLKSSFDVKLNADYANPDSLVWIVKKLEKNDLVSEIHYEKNLIKQINDNVKKISLYILIFSLLLLIVSLSLINNSIRLSIFSKRFLIKSMQLVGATKGFIRGPFLWKGAINGLYGGLFAVVMLLGFIFLLHTYEPLLFEFLNFDIIGIIFVGVIAIGIFISFISTYLALRKYLRLKIDELY